MSFVSATQTTDLDRADVIGAAVTEARANRVRNPKMGEMGVPELVEYARFDGDAAKLELVSRYEPQLRAAANRAKIAPQTDRQQAALTGFLAAVKTFDPAKGVDVYTHAHPFVLAEVRDANRDHSPRPAAARNQAYYWAAMDVCDGDAVKARRYCGLLRESVETLEPLAEAGDMLAREVLNARLDTYDACVRRDPDNAPEWAEYAARRGRGLDGPTFDAIHQSVTYLDASAETEDGEGVTGHDMIADPNARDPYAEIEERESFAQVLGVLESREREIIGYYLSGQTDRDTADAMGLSRTRVVNIRAAAIRKMRVAVGLPAKAARMSGEHPGWKGHPYWTPPHNGCGRA